MTEFDRQDRQITQDNPEDIKEFIRSSGLGADLLDERDETLEAWRLKWEGLAKGFMNYLQDRFTAIEQRLDRLDKKSLNSQNRTEKSPLDKGPNLKNLVRHSLH